MRISDWSSDVCSSDLVVHPAQIGLDRIERIGAAIECVVVDAFERGAIDAMRDGGDLLDRDIACIGQENPSDPPIPGIVAALDQAERLEIGRAPSRARAWP